MFRAEPVLAACSVIGLHLRVFKEWPSLTQTPSAPKSPLKTQRVAAILQAHCQRGKWLYWAFGVLRPPTGAISRHSLLKEQMACPSQELPCMFHNTFFWHFIPLHSFFVLVVCHPVFYETARAHMSCVFYLVVTKPAVIKLLRLCSFLFLPTNKHTGSLDITIQHSVHMRYMESLKL